MDMLGVSDQGSEGRCSVAVYYEITLGVYVL